MSERDPRIEAWIEEETGEQLERCQQIKRAMEELEPQRQKWIEDFFRRITTHGWFVDAGIRQQVPTDRLPRVPRGC